jgi:hypothetical protein
MKSEMVIMGNRRVDVISRGREHLALAIELLRNGSPLNHYLEEDEQLVLFWGPQEGKARELLYPLADNESITEFVWGWLKNKAPPKCRYDGGDVDNVSGGFRVWSGEWGKDEKYPMAFGCVEHRWAWIGK